MRYYCEFLFNGVCMYVCVCMCVCVKVRQSLKAGRWLDEEKFEMTDCFPAAHVRN